MGYPPRMIGRTLAALLVASAAFPGAALADAGAIDALFCAPGYPGTTEQAAPTMERFAGVLAAGMGVDRSRVRAVYHETEAGCLAALEELRPSLVLATLPFWLEHRVEGALRPVLLAVPPTGATESWALVAKRGRVAAADDLEGFSVESIAGFSPAFVRGPALSAWGALPDGASVTFTARALSSLRRVAGGEDVAVLLDGGQAAAIERLPFAADLEVVARSPEMPAYLVCDRGPGSLAREAVDALAGLDRTPDGRGALDEIRLERFESLPVGALDRVTVLFDRAAGRP